MKKKIIAVCLVVVLVLVAVFKILFDNKDPNKTLNEVKDNLTSYYMEGRMTLYNGEDKREFDVKVSYDYKDEVDFFKVSLFDLGINQEQIIIKNLDGVYVISPSLNKVYKFNGSWPMNSPKPYIYQSMIDLKEGEYELKEVNTNIQLDRVSVEKAVTNELFKLKKINVDVLESEKKILLGKEEVLDIKVQQIKEVEAPIDKGEQLGSVLYTLNGRKMAEYPIISMESVKRIDFFWIFSKIMELYLK